MRAPDRQISNIGGMDEGKASIPPPVKEEPMTVLRHHASALSREMVLSLLADLPPDVALGCTPDYTRGWVYDRGRDAEGGIVVRGKFWLTDGRAVEWTKVGVRRTVAVNGS